MTPKTWMQRRVHHLRAAHPAYASASWRRRWRRGSRRHLHLIISRPVRRTISTASGQRIRSAHAVYTILYNRLKRTHKYIIKMDLFYRILRLKLILYYKYL
jgi:hypothetical protein